MKTTRMTCCVGLRNAELSGSGSPELCTGTCFRQGWVFYYDKLVIWKEKVFRKQGEACRIWGNVVWYLSKSPGSESPDLAPSCVVQKLCGHIGVLEYLSLFSHLQSWVIAPYIYQASHKLSGKIIHMYILQCLENSMESLKDHCC